MTFDCLCGFVLKSLEDDVSCFETFDVTVHKKIFEKFMAKTLHSNYSFISLPFSKLCDDSKILSFRGIQNTKEITEEILFQ